MNCACPAGRHEPGCIAFQGDPHKESAYRERDEAREMVAALRVKLNLVRAALETIRTYPLTKPNDPQWSLVQNMSKIAREALRNS